MKDTNPIRFYLEEGYDWEGYFTVEGIREVMAELGFHYSDDVIRQVLRKEGYVYLREAYKDYPPRIWMKEDYKEYT